MSALAVAATALCATGCSSGDDRVAVPGATVAPNVTTASASSITPTTTIAPATTAPPTTTTTTVVPTPPPPTTAAPTTSGPSTTVPPVDGPYYRVGDEGPEIAIIQLKLATVGFLEAGYTEGVFDSATNDAVLEFQGQYGLLVDGVVGPQTDRALTAAAVSVDAEP